MFVRKTLVALASLAVAGAGMLALASPVHAEQTATIGCTEGGNTDRTLDGAGPWTFVLGACGDFPSVSVSRTAEDIRGPGDGQQVTVFNDQLGNGVYGQEVTGNANPPPPNIGFYQPIGHGVRITYERDGGPEEGTIVVDFRDDIDFDLKQTFEITLGDGGGDDGGDDGGDGGGDDGGDGGGDGGDTPSGDSGSTDAVSGLGPHIQEFAMPETGTCDEAQSEGLNWGGAASGGWGESWAQCVNDGEGGLVCTRTLVYNTSMAAWEVD